VTWSNNSIKQVAKNVADVTHQDLKQRALQ